MGVWDHEYCLVCGGPPYVFFDYVDEEKPETPPPIFVNDVLWLGEFVGISHTEEVIRLSSYDGYGRFSTQEGEKYKSFNIGCGNDGHGQCDNTNEAHGYACHVSCYTLLQRELNYTLRYQDVRPLLGEWEDCAWNTFAWSDYGGIVEYHCDDRGFTEYMLVEECNLWMLQDPTTDSRNAERIPRLWRPLVHGGFKQPELCANSDATPHQPTHDIPCHDDYGNSELHIVDSKARLSNIMIS